MSDEAQKLSLTILKRLDAKVDQLAEDMRDLKARVTLSQEGVASAQRRIDRVEEYLARVERDLADLRSEK